MAVATDSTVSSGAVTTSTDSAPFNGAPIDTFLVTSQGSGYPELSIIEPLIKYTLIIKFVLLCIL